jgi:hypothetical protein
LGAVDRTDSVAAVMAIVGIEVVIAGAMDGGTSRL